MCGGTFISTPRVVFVQGVVSNFKTADFFHYLDPAYLQAVNKIMFNVNFNIVHTMALIIDTLFVFLFFTIIIINNLQYTCRLDISYIFR